MKSTFLTVTFSLIWNLAGSIFHMTMVMRYWRLCDIFIDVFSVVTASFGRLEIQSIICFSTTTFEVSNTIINYCSSEKSVYYNFETIASLWRYISHSGTFLDRNKKLLLLHCCKYIRNILTKNSVKWN